MEKKMRTAEKKARKRNIILTVTAVIILAALLSAFYIVFIYIGDGSYHDVDPNSDEAAAVYYCKGTAMLTEKKHRTFMPDESALTAELLRALWVHDENPELKNRNRASEEEFEKAVNWAEEEGIINSGEYGKDGILKRRDLAAVMFGYEQKFTGAALRYDTEGLSEFSDREDEGYAGYEDSLAWATQNGIIEGTEEGKLLPGSPATRLQLAQALYVYFKLSLKTPGIDISVYQKGLSADGMAAADTGFVYVRLYREQGGKEVNGVENADSCFEDYYESAKEKGLRVGGYWFMYATGVDEAVQEANDCIKLLQGRQWDLPVALDIEEASISYMESVGVTPTEALVSAMVSAFCERLTEAGYEVIIYSNANMCFYAGGQGYISEECLEPYGTWVAQWISNGPLSKADIIKVRSGVTPAPQGNSNLYKNAVFWQIGSTDGATYGLEPGRLVDVNIELERE